MVTIITTAGSNFYFNPVFSRRGIKMAALGSGETMGKATLLHSTEISDERQRPERYQSSSETRRKNRKHRYRKQGYHKTERENSRRVEARNFLSGITLDSHCRLPAETQEQDTVILQMASQQSGVTSSVEDGLMSSSDLLLSEKLLHSENLHDMASDLFELYSSHHSPVKMALSKSQDQGFDSSQTPVINRSASLFEAASTPTYDQRRAGLHHIAYSKSLGSSVDTGEVHYCGQFTKFPVMNNRYLYNYVRTSFDQSWSNQPMCAVMWWWWFLLFVGLFLLLLVHHFWSLLRWDMRSVNPRSGQWSLMHASVQW